MFDQSLIATAAEAYQNARERSTDRRLFTRAGLIDLIAKRYAQGLGPAVDRETALFVARSTMHPHG